MYSYLLAEKEITNGPVIKLVYGIVKQCFFMLHGQLDIHIRELDIHILFASSITVCIACSIQIYWYTTIYDI